ncbi:MAG: elongation factor P [Dehalococcoidia bacterium]
MAIMVPTSDLSRGMILEIGGSLHTVLEHQRFLAGKGNSEARVRVKMRDVKSGYTQEKVFRTDERVPKANVDSRAFQFLYNDGDLFHFMDGHTYEEKIIARDALGAAPDYLTDGLSVQMLVYKDEPVSVELPITVDLRIAETDPGYKGDTAQGGTKKATTETGLKVDVPLFLNTGDVIKVDTRRGEYLSRV